MLSISSRAECTAEAAQAATGGRAIFASGSPFDDVTIDGVTIASSQCNNRYIFPGLALGAALGQTGVVTNAMINKSAEVSKYKMPCPNAPMRVLMLFPLFQGPGGAPN